MKDLNIQIAIKIYEYEELSAADRCAQNAFPKVVSELLRRKNK